MWSGGRDTINWLKSSARRNWRVILKKCVGEIAAMYSGPTPCTESWNVEAD
jgi:hypothetical protein